MFPERSDFTSGAGGAAWYTIDDASDDPALLFQTQWPTLVRSLQTLFKSVIDTPLYAFNDSGSCGQGSTIEELGAIFRTNARRADAVTIDGRWGRETADMLGWLLCKTGQTSMAQLLGQSIRQKGPIPPDIVREVILFGRHVVKEDLAAQGQVAALPANKAELGGQIGLPADTLLPRWDADPTENSRDVGWVGQSEWGGSVPNPPSRMPPAERAWPGAPGTTTTPPTPAPPPAQPPAEALGGLSAADGLALAGAAAAWLLTPAGRRAPAETRRRVSRAIPRAISRKRGKRGKRKEATKKAAPKKSSPKKAPKKAAKKGTRKPRKKAASTAKNAPKSTPKKTPKKAGKRAKRMPRAEHLDKLTEKERGARAYAMDLARRGRPLEKANLEAHEYGKREQAVARYWYRKEKEGKAA